MRSYFRKLTVSVDKALDPITLYRLVLYFLIFTVGWAVLVSFTGELPFEWYQILSSAALLVVACYSVSFLFARWLNIPRNFESDFISALILTLILTPANSGDDYVILAASGALAMASKYALAPGRRHIFNPAAFGAFSAAAFFDYYPSWWVGTAVITPIVLIGGLLILRKMQRFILSGVFVIISLAILLGETLSNSSGNETRILWLALSASPLIFFACIMLIEPLTSPYQAKKYIPYTVLVAMLYSINEFKFSPEEALLAGNVVAWVMARERRYRLKFTGKKHEAEGVYSFIFQTPEAIRHTPGQYMEWTLPGGKMDSRGNRRYFTVSASDSENFLMLTTKFPDKHSTFKQSLLKLKLGDDIIASHVSGTFTLPDDKSKKVALIAGGIGVTPYRSMAKHAVDNKEKRDVMLMYAANSPDEFAFTSLFNQAKSVGWQAKYVVTEPKNVPDKWKGYGGKIDAKLIKATLPDYKERVFYLSGPHGLVQYLEEELALLKIPATQVKTDYFPGYG